MGTPSAGASDPPVGEHSGWQPGGEEIKVDSEWIETEFGRYRRGEPTTLPGGIAPAEPEIRDKVEVSGGRMVRHLAAIAERDGALTDDEQKLANYLELRKQLMAATTLEEALAHNTDPHHEEQLCQAARTNQRKIASLGGRMLDDAEHPVARTNIDDGLSNGLRTAGTEAENAPSGTKGVHWSGAYSDHRPAHESLRFLANHSEIEKELWQKAGKAKGKRQLKAGLAEAHAGAKQNFGDAVGEGLSGTTVHESDLDGALKILREAFNAVRATWPGGVGTVQSIISAAVAPALHAMLRDGDSVEYEEKYKVAQERSADTVDNEFARAAGLNVAEPDSMQAQEAHTHAKTLEKAFARTSPVLAGRLATEIEAAAHETGTPVNPEATDIAVLAGRRKAQNLDAETLVAGTNAEAGQSLEAALLRGSPLPPHITQAIEGIERAAGTTGEVHASPAERCAAAARSLTHLQEVEETFERFAGAGKKASELASHPEFGARLNEPGMEGPKAMTQMLKSFETLSAPTTDGRASNALSCAEVRARIEGTWSTIPSRTREALAGVNPQGAEKDRKGTSPGPNEERGFVPDMGLAGNARWAARMGRWSETRMEKATGEARTRHEKATDATQTRDSAGGQRRDARNDGPER